MEKRIERILKDLYRIDPALREREEDMKKVIREMLEGKPDASIDPAFERELKAKLLAGFSEKENKKPLPFFARPAFFIPAGTAAAACLVALLTLPFALQKQTTPVEGSLAAPIAQAPVGQSPSASVDDPKTKGAATATAPAMARASDADRAAGLAANQTSNRVAMQPADKTAATPSAKTTIAAAEEKAKEAEAIVADAMIAEAYAAAPAPEQKRERLLPGLAARTMAKAAPKPQASTRPVAGYADLEDGVSAKKDMLFEEAQQTSAQPNSPLAVDREFNTEAYDTIKENPFQKTVQEPLSTFSIDVDTASYANVRRFLEGGELPPPDAVRIEELVNYFPYNYAEPSGDAPLAWNTALAVCPWNADHYLLRVGLQAKRIAAEKLPPSNLVFLLDVSGSMEDENKLPLVKDAMKILVKNLRKQDRISIVVYAGAAGLVLEPTGGDKKDAILAAIDNLEAGGSTAGGEGIELAYATAKSAFMPKGNNRVILASDGDFNVGASSDAAMVRLIEEKRKTGIFLTVLGFGMGNYKDSKMQKLADSGNGNYAYVDSLSEAKKVLEKQMAGTLFTLAKDVKIQIEFNPATVAQYRLIGYEKRILAAQDFDDDAKDAGELGAGHTVTALYEIVAAAGNRESRTDLRYQQTTVTPAADSGDLMTIKFRYKKPDGDKSLLLETPVPWSVADRGDADFRFAAAVAEWGLLLRNSEHKGSASYSKVLDLASGSVSASNDADGYRKAFLGLVEKTRSLTKD